MLRKPRPEDFKPVSEASAVRRAQALVEKAEARAREAAERVVEAEQLVTRARETAVDVALAGGEPDHQAFLNAEDALKDARRQRGIADGAVERAKAQLAEAQLAARKELIERLTAASRECAKDLNRKIGAAVGANERIMALWARANELGVGNEVPRLGYTGRLNADALGEWRREIAGAKAAPKRSDLVTVRFVKRPPEAHDHMLGGRFNIGDVAGFERRIADRLVRESLAVYTDDPGREPPPEKPEPVKASAPGDAVVVKFRRKWMPGLGRTSFMKGDVTSLEASVASGLVAEGVAVVFDHDADESAPTPASAPASVAGQTGAPALEVREDA